jgi:ATP-binding cassette subfamily B protein/subfamily B ATP-binding cassette protein MsbA
MRAETPRVRRGHGYRRLFSYATPYKRDWATIVAATLLSTALSLLQPWPLKVLVDHVLGDTPLRGTPAAVVERLPWAAAPGGLLAWVVLAGIFVFAVNSAVNVVLALQWTKVGRRMVYQLACDLFARVQRRSLHTHARQSVGDAMGRVAVDAWCVHAVIDTMLFAPGHALFTTVVMVVVMFRLDAGLTLLALAVAPFMTAAAWLFGRPVREAARARREIESRIQAHVHQTLTGVSVVQAFAREEDEQRRFQDLASVAIQAHQRSTLVGSLYGLGSGLVTTVGTAAVMWAAAMRVLDGRFTVGTALVFLAYLASLQWQLSAFANMYTALQSAGASIDRVMDVFTADDAVPEGRGARPLPPVRGDVSIEDVVFGYLPDRPVLQGVSIAAAAGETIAIVGSTGAGKTTLVGLIARFYDPAAGRVLIDGHDVRQVQIKSLRDQVAIVLQEPFLFPISVAENISLGRPEATRGEIEAAARAANAHEFITALPRGYDTIVGERGTTLSGGERQRMAIARALLKNAPILVLDEPTSALDAETEHAIVDGLQRLMRGRTTFIVAHRLSTIRNATRIVVLEDGKVVEQGTHRQLLIRGGRFSELYHLQFAERAGSVA